MSCTLAALQEKRIKGAALDVTEVEPLPEDSPLYELDNVLLSPHCADRTATFQVRQWCLQQQFLNANHHYGHALVMLSKTCLPGN